MKKINIIWRIFLVLTPGLLLNYWSIRLFDDEFIFDGFILIWMIVIFMVAFIWINIRDIREYKRTKSKLSFIPTLIGLSMFISFLGVNHFLKSRDNSPLIIQAGYDGGFNGAWFEFREGGSYKFVNSGGIGATIFRGSYAMKDSIIVLDKSDIDNVIETKLLVIREVHNYYYGARPVRMLFQINERHEIIDKEFCFTVNIDNR